MCDYSPCISIIIPVHNVSVYLERSLESVINQTYPKLEIIIINDGSTDDSGSICDYYAKLDNRIKVIHQKNQGVSSARNQGLEIAKGNWIGFVDPDDAIKQNMYEKMLYAAQNDNTQVALCCFESYEISGRKRNIIWSGSSIIRKVDALEGIVSEQRFAKSVCNKLFSSKLIGKTRFNEKVKCGEDHLFVVELLVKMSGSISYIPECLYQVYRRKGSASAVYHPHRLDAVEVSERVLKIVSSISERLAHKAQADIVKCCVGGIILPFDGINEYILILAKKVRLYFVPFLMSDSIPTHRKIIGVVVAVFPRICFQLAVWLKIYRTRPIWKKGKN